MSLPNQGDPASELTTARTGGRSARLIALGVALVLVSFVYVGISGNSGAPAHTASPAGSQLAAQVASPTPVIERATPYPGATEIRANPSVPRPHRYLGARLEIAGTVTIAILTTPERGQLHAAYQVPLPAPADTASVELVDVIDEQPRLATYGSWTVPLNIFHGGIDQDSVIGAFGPTVLVESLNPPDPTTAPTAPAVARKGYGIQITGERREDTEVLFVDLSLGSEHK